MKGARSSFGTHPREEGVVYRTHHRVVSKEFNYLTTVYTQLYTCGFPKISGERRQLCDACDTRTFPLYAKGASTETMPEVYRVMIITMVM